MNNSWTVFFVTAAALWLAQPTTAEASGAFAPSRADYHTAMGALVLTTSAIGFGIADTLYFAHDRPMPIALAVLQIVVAGALVPVSALRSNDHDVRLFAAISSAWFIGHGVYSFAAWSMRERERQRAVAAERERLAACAVDPARRSLLCWPRR